MKRLLLFLSIFLLFVVPVTAQDPPGNLLLQEIARNIENLSNEQSKLTKEIDFHEKAIKGLEQELQSLDAELLKLSVEEKDKHNLILKLEEESSDFNERISLLKTQSLNRLRAFYTANRGQNLFFKLSGAAASGAERYWHYFRKLRDFEIETTTELNRLNTERSIRTQALQQALAQQAETISRVSQVRLDAETKKKKLSQSVSKLSKQKSEKAKLIARHRAEALRVESALTSLGSGTAQEEVQTEEAQQSAQSRQTEATTELAGLGEAKLKAPAEGLLLTKFGSSTLDTLGQKTVSRGLGFAVETGSEIHSVAKGKVVYLGTLGDYGQIVIIDHGARTHTLYGSLQSIAVSSGQIIEEGQVLGVASRIVPPKPYNFYFELRVAGKAQNPAGMLALAATN